MSSSRSFGRSTEASVSEHAVDHGHCDRFGLVLRSESERASVLATNKTAVSYIDKCHCDFEVSAAACRAIAKTLKPAAGTDRADSTDGGPGAQLRPASGPTLCALRRVPSAHHPMPLHR